jgi:hypothetical protein
MSRNIKFRISPANKPDAPDELTKRPARHRGQTPAAMYGVAALWRLGFLCLMLVLVLIAMNQAAKPETWNWLFRFDQPETPGAPAETEGRFENSGTGNLQDDMEPDKTLPANRPGRLSATASVAPEQQFWNEILPRLAGPHQVRLFNMVQSVTQRRGLPAGSTAVLQPLLEELDRWRDEFTARQTDEAQAEPLRRVWQESLFPAFQAVLDDEPESVPEDDAVRQLPGWLQQAAQKTIRDKTPVDRGREAYAWFTAWSDIYDQPIEPDSGRQVTVPQLLSQPEAWRGQTLRIEGTAMRIERIPASHNVLGIQRYYVLWIKPDHPSMYPWCVYTLMAPEALVGEPAEPLQIIEQRVTTTATFFKNRLFQAEAGAAAFAPVLLTAAVEIPPAAPSGRSPFRLPGRFLILLTLGVIGGLAVLLAVTVYRSTEGRHGPALPQADKLREDFEDLQSDARVESPAEKLQRMSRKDQSGSNSGDPADRHE